MTTLWFDTETFSELDLGAVGAWVYAHHCEVLLFAYALGDDPVQVWDRTKDRRMPEDLEWALKHSDTYIAHNSQFDRWVLKYSMGIDLSIDKIKDTMILAYACSLPGNLEQLGGAVGLPPDFAKLQDGKKLIGRFCKPAPKNHKADRYTRETHPEEWARFIEYAGQDIVAMREIYNRIPAAAMSEFEWDIWRRDQEMNDRGFCIDRDLAELALELDAHGSSQYDAELIHLTHGAVTSVDKTAALRAWIEEQGVPCNSVAKAAVAKLLDTDIPHQVRRALEIRQEAGKSSVSKYQRMLDASQVDGRAHGGFQYGGAQRTLRWAGRLIQPQNLYRSTIGNTDLAAEALLKGVTDMLYEEPIMEILASCIRSAIVASPGKRLVVSDLSNIEGRGLAWLAGEQWKLDAYAAGKDLYIEAYARSFGTPVHLVDKDMRQIGKVMELALGYQGGVGAFVTFADVYGLDLYELVGPTMELATEEEIDRAEWLWGETENPGLPRDQFIACDVLKQKWRTAHPAISHLWNALNSAAVAAIEGGPGGLVYPAGPHLKLKYEGDYLLMRLPSGRFIWYKNPRIERGKIFYDGVEKRAWVSQYTYGGKLSENATQALARDIMAANMPAIDHRYEIIGTVHDEWITEVEEDKPQGHVELSLLMSKVPAWAEGLPLAAEGWEGKRYKK